MNKAGGEEPGEYFWVKDAATMVFSPGGSLPISRIVKSPRTEYVGPFYIDKHEVSVGQFRGFVQATRYSTTAEEELKRYTWRDPGFPQDDRHPVVCVSWFDAKAYCRWSGKRLPGLEEWEKAATWDPGLRRMRTYAWGDELPGSGRQVANLRDATYSPHPGQGTLLGYADGYKFTAPVDSFPDGASPCGALGMSGNASEWCEDENYLGSGVSAVGPLRPARIRRGGSWSSLLRSLPCAILGTTAPNESWRDLGFRTVVSGVN